MLTSTNLRVSAAAAAAGAQAGTSSTPLRRGPAAARPAAAGYTTPSPARGAASPGGSVSPVGASLSPPAAAAAAAGTPLPQPRELPATPEDAKPTKAGKAIIQLLRDAFRKSGGRVLSVSAVVAAVRAAAEEAAGREEAPGSVAAKSAAALAALHRAYNTSFEDLCHILLRLARADAELTSVNKVMPLVSFPELPGGETPTLVSENRGRFWRWRSLVRTATEGLYKPASSKQCKLHVCAAGDCGGDRKGTQVDLPGGGAAEVSRCLWAEAQNATGHNVEAYTEPKGKELGYQFRQKIWSKAVKHAQEMEEEARGAGGGGAGAPGGAAGDGGGAAHPSAHSTEGLAAWLADDGGQAALDTALDAASEELLRLRSDGRAYPTEFTGLFRVVQDAIRVTKRGGALSLTEAEKDLLGLVEYLRRTGVWSAGIKGAIEALHSHTGAGCVVVLSSRHHNTHDGMWLLRCLLSPSSSTVQATPSARS